MKILVFIILLWHYQCFAGMDVYLDYPVVYSNSLWQYVLLFGKIPFNALYDNTSLMKFSGATFSLSISNKVEYP